MKEENILIIFLSIVILINIITIILLFILNSDLSNKIDILENEKMKLNQENIELKWELDQVDEMICTNEEVEYEK